MNVTIDTHLENFVAKAVNEGRFQSANDMMSEGLRLIEEKELKLNDLRSTLNASIARVGHKTREDIMRSIDKATLELKAEGLS